MVSIYSSLSDRFLGFIGIILYPIDIGYSIEDKVANPKLKVLWDIVYWVTFFLSWVVIPILMEYWASGEFKAMYFMFTAFFHRYRLKEALWVNALFYIIVGVVGGVGGFLFARISDLFFFDE